jgi:hypothetical protein
LPAMPRIRSPVGAQGMNTGIQDAWNLGSSRWWQGRAIEPLLDSHHAERWPVGRTCCARQTAYAGFAQPCQGSRLIVVPAIVAGSSRQNCRRSTRAAAFHFVSQLGITIAGVRQSSKVNRRCRRDLRRATDCPTRRSFETGSPPICSRSSTVRSCTSCYAARWPRGIRPTS